MQENDPRPILSPAESGGRFPPWQGPRTLNELILEAEALLAAHGENVAPSLRRLARLRERLNAGRFHLAVLGQFKRGKTSLLNALLGEELLPTSVLPLTSIPTFVRPGARRLARIRFGARIPEELASDDRKGLLEFLWRYATEEGNPRNRLGVTEVEVEHPAPLLRSGVVIIDTPGIGSTHEHNTQATLNFLPQCDAALFLVSADPPITAVELEFLRAVRGVTRQLHFLLNKADYLAPAELDSAMSFLGRVVAEDAGLTPAPRIFAVSARRGLEARVKADPALWETSGLAALERDLVEMLVHRKAAALEEAIARKTERVLLEARLQAEVERRSLELPLRDLEARLARFRSLVDKILEKRRASADLLVGDQKRFETACEGAAAELLRRAEANLQPVALQALEGAIRAGGWQQAEDKVRRALADAVPEFFDTAVPDARRGMDRRLAGILSRHTTAVSELVNGLLDAAGKLFFIPALPPASLEPLRSGREAHWITWQWDSAFQSIPPAWIDRLVPAGRRMGRLRRRVRDEVNRIVARNVESFRWSTLKELDREFRAYSAELDQCLDEALRATRDAIERAHDRIAAGTAGSDPRRQSLEALAGKLEEAGRRAAAFCGAPFPPDEASTGPGPAPEEPAGGAP